MNIIQSPSKNFFGRNGHNPIMIVIHITDGYYPSDLEWLQGKDIRSQVSSSYYIAPNGDIHQLVQDDKSAWHAGVVVNPTANLLKKEDGTIINPNFYSYGIEVSIKPSFKMRPDPKETEEQWRSLRELVKYLCEKSSIPIDRSHIVGHHEIRDDKICPFPLNIDKFVEELNSVPPAPEMVVKEEFKNKIIDFIKSL